MLTCLFSDDKMADLPYFIVNYRTHFECHNSKFACKDLIDDSDDHYYLFYWANA